MTTTDTRLTRRPRRLGGLFALALLGSGVAGCGDSDTAGTDPGPSAGATGAPASHHGPVSTLPRPDVTFEAEVTPSAEALAVTYRLTNDGTEQLVVPNLLPIPSGATVAFVDSVVWATEDEGEGVLLAQAFFLKPETEGEMHWEQVPQVGVTVVEAGASVALEVVVPRPVEWKHPWGKDFGGGPITLPSDPTVATFCLGVTPMSEVGTVRQVDGVDLVNQDRPQHLLCSPTVPLAE